ncbi:hypothetical protein Bca52824_016613 [Brassica carinata]|uniref:Uncharacterized protein n=1 Tax=Brassica carinata TaxID=52824 RepID=A0A8X7W6R4_BRACI|nr:hypothetical protein Bca52824_016613 [Brassica carinata]
MGEVVKILAVAAMAMEDDEEMNNSKSTLSRCTLRRIGERMLCLGQKVKCMPNRFKTTSEPSPDRGTYHLDSFQHWPDCKGFGLFGAIRKVAGRASPERKRIAVEENRREGEGLHLTEQPAVACGTQVSPETRGLSSSVDIDAPKTIERLGHRAHYDLSDGEQNKVRRV